MSNEKHKVQLVEAERRKLIAIVSKGQNKAVVIQRAHILLKVDEGKTDAEISKLLYVSEQTIRRIRLRFAEEGLQAALEDKPHAPTGTEIKEEQEARLIALTCSEPPAGRARWTLELLVQQMLKDGIVTRVSPETVRLLLKKNKLKPWQVKSWCIPEVTPEFIKRMEHILELYQKPYDPKRPMVCFDEKSYQLLAHITNRLGLKPGRASRQDYEYERNGTRNLFMFVEPKAGSRHVLVTNRRTKQDFAFAMRYLVDVIYPDDECIIDVVSDNLNTHHYHSLVEFFGKQEADRIMNRLEFHHTPKHASWLNMAEIELSILSKQCLSRRIPSEWILTTEIVTWEESRNEKKAKIRWNFTVEDARKVFKEYCPTSLTC